MSNYITDDIEHAKMGFGDGFGLKLVIYVFYAFPLFNKVFINICFLRFSLMFMNRQIR